MTEALIVYGSGDFSKAVSIFIPQLEVVLRGVLKLLRIPTRKGLGHLAGASELKNVSDMLSNDRVVESLDENFFFFLRAVCIDKRGLNLRNDFVYGNLPSESFNAATGSLLVMSLVALAAIGTHTMYLADESPAEDVFVGD